VGKNNKLKFHCKKQQRLISLITDWQTKSKQARARVSERPANAAVSVFVLIFHHRWEQKSLFTSIFFVSHPTELNFRLII
jgi:hypothetical protein